MESENLKLLAWIASVNNILFANGHTQTIDADDDDSVLDWASGFSPHDAAERITGQLIPIEYASRAEVEKIKLEWLAEPERDAWDIFNFPRFSPFQEELKAFCKMYHHSTL